MVYISLVLSDQYGKKHGVYIIYTIHVMYIVSIQNGFKKNVIR